MMLTVITSIFGDYDELQPAHPGPRLRWILVTDRRPEDAKGWEAVIEEPSGDPIMQAKVAKAMPWHYTDDSHSIWVDGSISLKSVSAAWDLIARAHPIAQFVHPDRDCIYEEGAASLAMPRYANLPISAQLSSYRQHHPPHWGLWAAGLIARKHVDAVRDMGDMWLRECQSWGPQDQISEAYCLRKNSLMPTPIVGGIYNNRFTTWHGHKPKVVPRDTPPERWAEKGP